jgi:peptide-methionine (S)-S-oxide reductase
MWKNKQMLHRSIAFAAVFALAVPLAITLTSARAGEAMALPPPAVDATPASPGLQTAVFAGGCFWGVQGVFQHVKGVTRAVSGYAGGNVTRPSYEDVSSGSTGHAESVRVTFDPAQVSYGTLLRIFFSVALDPTQKDRQGPDSGTQYRSELFVANAEQEKVAKAYVAQLEAAHIYSKPIATRIDPAVTFWPAEAYHQDYLDQHPEQYYIAVNDIPKVKALHALFPSYWQPEPVKVGALASSDQGS